MANYRHSEWYWSKEQSKYYCAVYDENDAIVEYQWEGGYRQILQPSQAHSATPRHQPSSSQPSSADTLASQLSRLTTTDSSDQTPRSFNNPQQPQNSSLHNYQAAPNASTVSYHPTSPPLAHRTPQVSYNTSTQPYHTSSASQNTSSLEADYSVSPPPHYTTTRRTYTTTPYTQPTASSQPPYTASQSYHTTTSTSPYNSYSQYYHPHSQNQHTASSPHTSFSQPVTQSSLAQLPENIQKTVGGDKRNRHITTDNDGQDHEKLHPSFRRVAPRDCKRFFTTGRVFKMLWSEPVGTNSAQTRGSTHFSTVSFGEGVWSEIRRFVVINNKGSFSQCIPIQSYSNRGATKPGLVVDDHAVVYTGHPGTRPPNTRPGEELISKQALRVHPCPGESLSDTSRINFGKPYAVEHNVKLSEIGSIAPDHLHLLNVYFMDAMGFGD